MVRLNFTAFTVELEEGFKAADLTATTKAQVGDLNHIYKWNENRGIWVDHRADVPFLNNFDIEPGRGYTISVAHSIP